MILHIFNKQEKFSIQFIDFLLDNNFELENQHFFHYGKSSGYFEGKNANVLFSGFANPLKHIKLYKLMKKADKVVIHSLASPFLLLLLMMKFKVTKKFYWIIWGKDLYFKQCVNMKNPINKIYEFFRKKSLKNIKHIATNIRADYELACEWYGLNADLVYIEGTAYPYNSNEAMIEPKFKEKLGKILLGNSASVSNNHMEALEILKKNDDGKMTITAPLSYGSNDKYVAKVVLKGKELFGDRFIPLIDFMPLDKYNEILCNIDIAFFFHNRQEAFCNTLTLLGNGKKVYMRTESTVWDYFKEKKIVVHNSNEVDDNLLLPDSENIIKSNIEAVCKIKSIDSSIEFWKEMFKENE